MPRSHATASPSIMRDPKTGPAPLPPRSVKSGLGQLVVGAWVISGRVRRALRAIRWRHLIRRNLGCRIRAGRRADDGWKIILMTPFSRMEITGGIKTNYQHAELLTELGFDACTACRHSAACSYRMRFPSEAARLANRSLMEAIFCLACGSNPVPAAGRGEAGLGFRRCRRVPRSSAGRKRRVCTGIIARNEGAVLSRISTMP